jgi:two-component system CheB/CheR fusion protein
MSVHSLSNVADYASLLQGSEEEVKALLKDILISVTSFFRDPEAFEALKVQIKNMVNNKSSDNDLRIWVAGCATGEEAYSIAIVVMECLNEMEKNVPVQMYATDIDVNALNSARAGIYPVNIAADITAQRIQHFFLKEDKGYRVKKEIREMIVFAPQDFIKDPPFSKMDIICCRNLLIYLETEPQKKIIPLMHYALKPNGLLFLGTSETIGDATDLFTIVDKKWKIYRRREAVVSPDRLKFPVSFTSALREPADQIANLNETRLAELSEKIFMDNYAPTFVVVDEKYRLVYARGKTDTYLEIPSGHTKWSILDMTKQGLRSELASALYRAASEKKMVVQDGIHLKLNGGFQTINIKIVPMAEHGLPSGLVMIVFQEAGEIAAEDKKKARTSGSKHTAKVEEELRLTKETLQSTIEELEATNEEVKSANEELLSNNEELQSTNEELDTSREELQSIVV